MADTLGGWRTPGLPSASACWASRSFNLPALAVLVGLGLSLCMFLAVFAFGGAADREPPPEPAAAPAAPTPLTAAECTQLIAAVMGPAWMATFAGVFVLLVRARPLDSVLLSTSLCPNIHHQRTVMPSISIQIRKFSSSAEPRRRGD